MTPMFETLQQRAMKDRAEEQEGTVTIPNALFDQYNGCTMSLTSMIQKFNMTLTHNSKTKGSMDSVFFTLFCIVKAAELRRMCKIQVNR